MIVDGIDFDLLGMEPKTFLRNHTHTFAMYKIDGEWAPPLYLDASRSESLKQLRRYLADQPGTVSNLSINRTIAQLDCKGLDNE